MDNEKMGAFVAELRKEKGMTQRELAAKLNITDKAVSKWERGLSLPDIALLTPLAQELEVSVGELLDGEKAKSDRNDMANTLDYADKAMKNKVRSFYSVAAAVFSGALLVGIIVCVICDLAVSGGFTWSLFPVSSAVFAWAVFFPVIKAGFKRVVVSLGGSVGSGRTVSGSAGCADGRMCDGCGFANGGYWSCLSVVCLCSVQGNEEQKTVSGGICTIAGYTCMLAYKSYCCTDACSAVC